MNTVFQDLRYGARMFLRKPGFSLIVVLTLAIGIGANTAIFSVVNAVMLRSLPFAEPERLVVLRAMLRRDGAALLRSISYPDFVDWRDQNSSFEKIAARDSVAFNLLQGDEPERLTGEVVSADYFSLLGVRALKGRVFTPEEDSVPDAHRVAVMGYGLWQRRFGGDPDMVGQTIRLSDGSYTVIGIMPEGFRGIYDDAELWLPMMMTSAIRTAGILQEREQHWHQAVARLKPGVTLEQAQADMDSVTGSLEQAYPKTNTGRGARLILMHEHLLGDFQPTLLVLFGAVGFLLLIACANVANLLLARATSRQKETAIRTALGATQRRLIRQWLTESLLLTSVGGALGVLLAVWCSDLLISINPVPLPGFVKPSLDGRVLGFSLAITTLIGVVFGLAPALRFAKEDQSRQSAGTNADLSSVLKEGGRLGAGDTSRNRTRNLLVISEIALALVLLIGAVLMVRSFQRLQALDPGFTSEPLLTMNISLPARKYKRDQLPVFYRQVLERLQTLPDAQAVTIGSDLPLEGSTSAGPIHIEGFAVAPPGSEDRMYRHQVTPGFFAALGIPILQGRDFSFQDDAKAPGVIIINEDMARRYWPGENPLGKRLKETGDADDWVTVVGIVGNVKYRGLPQNRDTDPDVYFPLLQVPDRDLTLAVRTTLDPAAMTSALRGELQRVDSELPVYNVTTMAERIARQTAQSRFSTLLLSAFGLVALLLAGIGIYGVMAYTVARRTQEIGIRLALGAQPADVLKMVVGQGMRLALIGVGVGLAASLLLTRLLSKMLFDIQATDLLTFTTVALILTGVALVACFVPARRAAKTDPMIALRYE